jgi:hypothetical protein
MGLEAEFDTEPEAVNRITAMARRSSLPTFLDLLWPPCPHPLELMHEPGVMFESPVPASAIGSVDFVGRGDAV